VNPWWELGPYVNGVRKISGKKNVEACIAQIWLLTKLKGKK
jgi:hypothetical protein